MNWTVFKCHHDFQRVNGQIRGLWAGGISKGGLINHCGQGLTRGGYFSCACSFPIASFCGAAWTEAGDRHGGKE